jgi:hypothetical protein
VNCCVLLVPTVVVTLTSRTVAAAFAAIVNDTVRLFALVTFGVPTVTPVPLTATVVPPATKFVPVKATLTVFPATPALGTTAVSVGDCGPPVAP